MRWDAVLHPVGPLPAAAYWLRRAVVLGGIVVLLIVLGLIAGALGGGSSTPAKPAAGGITLPTPGLSAAPAASTPLGAARPSSTAALPTCADADLEVVLTTGAPSYPSGSLPQFVVTVTNTGAAACTRDLGPKATVITVVSGTDRIWSSGDCPSTKSAPATLSAGVAVKVTSSWDRDRSAPGCATTGAAGEPAKPGVYVASVKLGTLAAPGTAAFHVS